MTAQTPAPKASSVSTLLASLPTNPPHAPSSAQQDFLTVISLALAPKKDQPDSPPAAAPGAAAPAQEKPAPANADDAAASSLLLALLTSFTPPLAILAKPTPQKAAAPSVPFVPPLRSQATSAPDSKAISLAKSWTAGDSRSTAPVVKPLAVQLEAVAAQTEPNQKPPPKPDRQEAPEKPDRQAASPSGMSVAITGQRMNFAAQRNENAGPTEQKLPPGSDSAVMGIADGSASPQGRAKSSLNFSWRDAPSEELAVIDLSSETAAPALTAANSTGAAPAPSAPSVQVQRLEQLITREVVSIRQTGVETLGVLLKVDSKTQLLLQLTNRNGQVRATLRCERGDFSALGPQWAQLQQSLARQNVQLAPPAGSLMPSGFQPPPDQSQRQPAPVREEWPPAGPGVPAAQQRQQKNPNRSRRNWESWA
jgi:hypothetical protein